MGLHQTKSQKEAKSAKRIRTSSPILLASGPRSRNHTDHALGPTHPVTCIMVMSPICRKKSAHMSRNLNTSPTFPTTRLRNTTLHSRCIRGNQDSSSDELWALAEAFLWLRDDNVGFTPSGLMNQSCQLNGCRWCVRGARCRLKAGEKPAFECRNAAV